jgi:hypothetical protein
MGTFANVATANDYMTGRKPVPTPQGSEVLATRFEIALGTGDLDANDIGQVGWLPAGCVPVDVQVDGTDMDSSTAAMVFQVGILNSGGTDLSTETADGGAHWGATTAQNAAFLQRLTPNGRAMAIVQKSESARKLAVKVATAPTTAVAGTLGVTLLYRNA